MNAKFALRTPSACAASSKNSMWAWESHSVCIYFCLHKSELASMSEMGSLNPPLFFLIVDYLCLLQKKSDSYAFYMNLQ